MPKEKRGRSGTAQRGKGTAKWCTVRRTGKHSRGERERKEYQENVQNCKGIS